MLELQGKYASAKVFTDVVDSESISQVINLLNPTLCRGKQGSYDAGYSCRRWMHHRNHHDYQG